MTGALITGMAWTTALGSDLEAVWQSLLAGASGVTTVPSAHPLRNDRAAVVAELPADLDPVERQYELGARTLRAAVADADLDITDPRLRLVVGTSYGSHLDVPPDGLDRWGEALATGLSLARRPLMVSTACSAGSDAVLVGAALLAEGEGEFCVVGGVDVLTPAKRLGHSALGTMSPTALRAFDKRHDGTILGEGAAFLVLERPASAQARAARVRGRLSGAGSANDAAGPTAPDPSGDTVVRAVHTALAAAGRSPDEVGVLNAHGSGTPVNDEVECRAFASLFTRATSPVVFTTKGAFGHSLGATGALEAVAVLLALRDRQVPPVHGLETVMPGFPLPLPTGATALPAAGGVGLSVTIGFGGFTTCLALEAATSTGPPVSSDDLLAEAGPGLVTLASTRFVKATASPPRRRIPSLYADPASWTVLEAVDELWAACPDRVRAAPEATGMVLVSTHGTADTMVEIADAVPSGRVSPLRFAGASASGPISLTSLVHGFRGPTLMITSNPATGRPAALAVTRHWLRTGAADHVVISVHAHDPGRGHEVESVVLGSEAAR